MTVVPAVMMRFLERPCRRFSCRGDILRVSKSELVACQRKLTVFSLSLITPMSGLWLVDAMLQVLWPSCRKLRIAMI